ncbi:MAG: LD-carboxypeptidase [Bacteroidales bacterium]|nr:LD-carboxypeptidase [Bacteroidales bacterium]
MPEFLNEGDKVAIISPASNPKRTIVDSLASIVESWGLVPVLGEHVCRPSGYYAGSPQERRQDLISALEDPEIKAILCTRGGYGTLQVLKGLKPDIFRDHPKWIVGYSDITALLSAEICAGNMSIHSNMGHQLALGGGTDSISLMLKNLLFGTLPTYHNPPHHFDNYGSAEGILIGGNMSVYESLIASDFDFFKAVDAKNAIIFIEDIGEDVKKIERMLNHLILNGIIDNVNGIIVGRFVNCRDQYSGNTVFDIFHSTLKDLNIPIAYDFPVSHDETHNYPLIEGCRVRLDVGPEGSTLKFLGSK